MEKRIINKIKATDNNEVTLFLIAIAIVVIMAFISPTFLTGSTISSMMAQMPEFGIMCEPSTRSLPFSKW